MRHEAGGTSFIEFIGFVVTLAGLLFLFLKQFFEDLKKKRNPQEYAAKQREKERVLKELLGERAKHSYEDEDEEDEDEEDEDRYHVTPPPFSQARNTMSLDKVTRHDEERRVKQRAITQPRNKAVSSSYEVVRHKHTSRGASLINKLPSRKDLFIINEIMKPPVSLRSREENIW